MASFFVDLRPGIKYGGEKTDHVATQLWRGEAKRRFNSTKITFVIVD